MVLLFCFQVFDTSNRRNTSFYLASKMADYFRCVGRDECQNCSQACSAWHGDFSHWCCLSALRQLDHGLAARAGEDLLQNLPLFSFCGLLSSKLLGCFIWGAVAHGRAFKHHLQEYKEIVDEDVKCSWNVMVMSFDLLWPPSLLILLF